MLPRQPSSSCRLGRACVDLVDSRRSPAFALIWSFSCKWSATRGGILDAQVKAHNLIREAHDPETQLQFAFSGGRDTCTALAFIGNRQPKEFFAHGLW